MTKHTTGFSTFRPCVRWQAVPVCLTSVLIFCGAANAEWKKHVVVTKATSIINSAVAHDFDGDKAIDILSSYDGRVVLLRGPDWKPQTLHVFDDANSKNKPRTSCIHSCLMDVDGDGDQDFCGSNNTVFWLECPDHPLANKPWTYRTIDDEILGTHCLITGDVNRDGRVDLIANSGRPADRTTIPESLTWLEVPQDSHAANNWNRHVFADSDAPGGSHYTGFGISTETVARIFPVLRKVATDFLAVSGSRGGSNRRMQRLPGANTSSQTNSPVQPTSTPST